MCVALLTQEYRTSCLCWALYEERVSESPSRPVEKPTNPRIYLSVRLRVQLQSNSVHGTDFTTAGTTIGIADCMHFQDQKQREGEQSDLGILR